MQVDLISCILAVWSILVVKDFCWVVHTSSLSQYHVNKWLPVFTCSEAVDIRDGFLTHKSIISLVPRHRCVVHLQLLYETIGLKSNDFSWERCFLIHSVTMCNQSNDCVDNTTHIYKAVSESDHSFRVGPLWCERSSYWYSTGFVNHRTIG